MKISKKQLKEFLQTVHSFQDDALPLREMQLLVRESFTLSLVHMIRSEVLDANKAEDIYYVQQRVDSLFNLMHKL